jgi:anti-sigma regulatory factor (Ser/Thr protein kinase)
MALINKKQNGLKYEFSFKVILFTITFTTISILLIYNLLLVKKTDIYSGKFLAHTLDSYLNKILTDIESSDSSKISRDQKDSIIIKLQSFIDNSGNLIFLSTRINFIDYPVSYNQKLRKFITFDDVNIEKDLIKQINVIKVSENYVKMSFKFGDNKFDIHYSIYDNLEMLQYFPFIQLLVITFLTILTFFGYSFFKSNKESEMWIAMSKETAHQLGTPITSLSGWQEYLFEIKSDIEVKNKKMELVNKSCDSINETELNEIYKGIGIDIKRINLVLERFSKISSEPEKGYYDIERLITNVTNYLSSRIPNKDNSIEIKLDFYAVDIEDIYLSKILIEWTLENLIKNSLQAIEFDKVGLIKIVLKENKNRIIIDIEDNGKGLKNHQFKQIFNAGYTTKKRGWGLGLSLAKRVIEEYHDGKLFVLKSKQNQGTTIRILLNKFV